MNRSSKSKSIAAFTAFSAALSLPACASHTRQTVKAALPPVAVRAAAPDGANGTLIVKVDQPGVKISPLLYGLMTEEINHSYDGGLYGELIQNRALKDNGQSPAHWSAVTAGTSAATIALDTDHPANTALTASLKLDISAADAGNRAGVANDGYWGIPARPNTTYQASFYARASEGFHGSVTAAIESNDGGKVLAAAKPVSLTSDWKKYTVTLKTGAISPSEENRFVLATAAPGTLWFTQVSLFPPTYKGTPNGNRIDLMQKLGAMNPSFLRLPGGNYLEGNTIPERFEWKDTLGPIDQRPGHWGPWGYRSTDGMGIYEFLKWCEDLNMEPVLAVYAGYSLRGDHVNPGPDLAPYVQDALDEIEYVTGDTSTKWGAQRAKDGHPKPFPLTYVEIGNEDWFDRSGSYDGRFAQFYDAIKAKYPKLKLISTAGVKSRKADLNDEHFYRSAAAMERDVHRYDSYDRNGTHVFVGEWASTEGNPTPNFNAALGDAAWLTGIERNSDVVEIESYAPLLVNVNPRAAQWGTNLIGYDALNSFGSPSYYMQSMFGSNRGDVVLPVDLNVAQTAPVANTHPTGKVGVGTWITQSEYKDISVTHAGQTLYTKDFTTGDADWKTGNGSWKVADGALQQTGDRENCRATAGDVSWSDYTYHLKARKIGGREGFLIIFHYKDDQNFIWWNIGGWGNSRTGLERAALGDQHEIGQSSPVTVETGRWYDIRIETEGSHIRCYLDDKLVSEADDIPPTPPTPIYSTASRDLKTGDVILKVVNVSADPQPLAVSLQGAKNVASTASAIVLTGDPGDVNSLAEPQKVAPKTETITGVSGTFTHEFPAHSITVLRVKAAK